MGFLWEYVSFSSMNLIYHLILYKYQNIYKSDFAWHRKKTGIQVFQGRGYVQSITIETILLKSTLYIAIPVVVHYSINSIVGLYTN